MIRQVIKIDENKCIGCGLCARACHEGAIAVIEGKAKLLRDDYCDGLGNCLPVCPTNAISFEQREAAEFNRDIAPKRIAQKESKEHHEKHHDKHHEKHHEKHHDSHGCKGSMARELLRSDNVTTQTAQDTKNISQLRQWPVQIKLVPINAPYFENANLLIAADCSAYAYADFHSKFMKNKVTLIGCPKLDEGDYQEKLTAIIRDNNIKSLTIVRMEVPCCGGIERAAVEALKDSKKFIPWQVVTISTDGRIIEE